MFLDFIIAIFRPLNVFLIVLDIKSCNLSESECVCVMTRDADRCAYTESTALLTALDWSGLDQVGLGHRMTSEVEGTGGAGGVIGMQPSLRQHKQHADTVTGNTVIIILLFKVLLKTLKLYKKEENRIFALMKNTFFVFFFPPPTKKVLIQENKYSKKAKK